MTTYMQSILFDFFMSKEEADELIKHNDKLPPHGLPYDDRFPNGIVQTRVTDFL